MPPLPNIVVNIISHGASFFKNRNCPNIPVAGSNGSCGIHLQIKTNINTPHTVLKRNGTRHEIRLLSIVPSGTPKRLAIVIPAIITDTACEALPSSATFSATIEPAPKNAPCGNPEIKRIHNSMP